MTRPLNLARPVRCARCGDKFTRRHGRERLCIKCKRPDVKARNAARSAVVKAEAAVQAGTGCQYPACGHKLAERVIDGNWTCRPR